MKINWTAVAVVMAMIAGLLMWRGNKFEQRAKAAEAFNAAAQRQVDSLRIEAMWYETQAAKTDTVVRTAKENVARVDTVYPPGSSCMPNLAARDTVIAAQDRQIAQLKAVNERLGKALVLLQGANDTLSVALASRPGFVARHLHGPTVGPAVWLFPGEVRVGISVQVFGLSL